MDWLMAVDAYVVEDGLLGDQGKEKPLVLPNVDSQNKEGQKD